MAIDFGGVATTDNYSSTFVPKLNAVLDGLAKGLDPANVSYTGTPFTNSIRWNSASSKWEKYNGSTWVDLAATYAIAISGNAATVTTNANLTGPITSTGNATAVAAQTGTGSTFVMQASPSFTGVVNLPSGGVGAPSLTLNGETTTGPYRIGANNHGYAVSGAKVLDIKSTGLAVTGLLSGSTGLAVASGQKVNFDGVAGTGNTYIYENGADVLTLVAGGNPIALSGATTLFDASGWNIFTTLFVSASSGVTVLSGAPIAFDGTGTPGAGGDTHIVESAANTLDFYSGNTNTIKLNASGMAAGNNVSAQVPGTGQKVIFDNTSAMGLTDNYSIRHLVTATAPNANARQMHMQHNALTFALAGFANSAGLSAGGGAIGYDTTVSITGSGSGSMTAATGYYALVSNDTTSLTVSNMTGYQAAFANPAGTVTNTRGFYVGAHTIGSTLRTAFYGDLASSTTVAWNAYMNGTAPNYFEGNVCIGSTAFDSTGTQTLTITSGTAPAAGVADTVALYSSDDAAGHTVPSFYCEGTNVVATGQSDSASSVRVKMRINGTVRTFLCI